MISTLQVQICCTKLRVNIYLTLILTAYGPKEPIFSKRKYILDNKKKKNKKNPKCIAEWLSDFCFVLGVSNKNVTAIVLLMI
jgi:hypothetical protein